MVRKYVHNDYELDIEKILARHSDMYFTNFSIDMRGIKVGTRVRPSHYGIYRNVFTKTRYDQSGVVTGIKNSSVSVLWNGRKTPRSYYPGFIEIDKWRKRV